MIYKNYLKTIFDFLASSILLLILIPFLTVIILILLIPTNLKPLFIQKRTGFGNKSFNLIKFRTMREIFDSRGEVLPDMQRVTRIGRIIRELSIDELPQIINVIKGDMSLIGPRPLPVEYLQRYDNKQIRRHEVKPGITGWAQVNGRNSISWEERFEFDLWYVENLSFRLDLKILWKTILKVLLRSDINADKNHSMPVFEGEKL